MNQLKQFKKQHTDKKIKTSGRIYMLLVLLMFIIVIVDSFEHDLPFYYILYGFAGIIIGRFSEKELRDKAFEAFCKGGD